ncbi:uncharacterized protein LOC132176477 isoform X2 [Corylus avellana]|uniref:uncharacterized protein LOC132176477 isoform X2 n=1 Tax=Corylus avellana TaxID=13451 RepID=UPI00286A28AA|nr:uncharacterized protein LOC132176477 isoform X2 [Corylus avellana]
MVQVCFVLDLRSLPPPFLRDVKQSLLQVANFYAISSSSSSLRKSNSLRDRIGFCYIFKNRFSSSDELKIAYRPRENFNLRDFHQAVNQLPLDAFLPQINDSAALCHPGDLKLSTILSDQFLYSWGTGKDIARKVIVLSSCFPEDVDSIMRKSLTDAADKCVSVEFMLFEQKSGHLTDTQQNMNNFFRYISDLDNCSFQTYLPDVRVLHGLVKRWKADLEDDAEEPLQAHFLFKNNLVGSVNQISCNLYISVNKIIDGFSPCQTCSCHGIPLEDGIRNRSGGPSCPATGHDLGKDAVMENSVKVGENIMLFLPSCQSSMKFQKISSSFDFNVVERINLGSLSEVFRGLCSALYSLDQGLVCSSSCNIETMKEAAFHCYYILQPSDNGPMLLRRLAGSEEVSCVPDLNQCIHASVTKEIQNSIQSSLSMIELKDYDPMVHERGFHQKLNLLVKESLQFGSLPPKFKEAASEPKITQPDSLEEIVQSNSGLDVVLVEAESPQFDVPLGEDKTSAHITEEWEQLVVNEVPKIYSSARISKHKLDQSVLSPANSNRQLDVKTSRILERLEVPRRLKTKAFSPVTTSSGMMDTCVPRKKPLTPLLSADATASQLMKPNFQRLKRKHK